MAKQAAVEIIQQGAVIAGREVIEVETSRSNGDNVAALQLSDGTTVQLNREALMLALAELDDAEGFDQEFAAQGGR
jgi:hypothetical protein